MDDEAVAMYIKALITGFCLSIKDLRLYENTVKFNMEPESGTAQSIGNKLTYEFPNGTKLQVRFDLLPPGNWEICATCGAVIYNDRSDPEKDPVWLAAASDDWICPVSQSPHRPKEV